MELRNVWQRGKKDEIAGYGLVRSPETAHNCEEILTESMLGGPEPVAG